MSNVWRFTGPPENWITGLGRGYWALNEHNKSLWVNNIQSGDIALMHSTARSDYSNKVESVIIGYAVIADKKFVKDENWWIQEVQAGECMWPYVFSIDKAYLFQESLNIDFGTAIEEKDPEQIKREVEELASTGFKLSKLNEMAKAKDASLPNFPVNGSASGVNEFYEQLLLESDLEFFPFNEAASNFEEIEERYAESIQEEVSTKSKEEILQMASSFIASGPSHTEHEGKVRLRRENAKQKAFVKVIEDHSCQFCGFSCSYKNKVGQDRWIVHADHIIDKCDGGTEELSNLWVLCPNCHEKKTRGVIVIDPKKKKILENGKEVSLHHDSHLNW